MPWVHLGQKMKKVGKIEGFLQKNQISGTLQLNLGKNQEVWGAEARSSFDHCPSLTSLLASNLNQLVKN